MAGLDPPPAAAPSRSGLVPRVASALLLAPLAILCAYIGGPAFELFWGAAAIIGYFEWTSLALPADRRSARVLGIAAIVIALLLVGSSVDAAEPSREMRLLAALLVITLAALVSGAFAPGSQRLWAAFGIPYAAAIGIAPTVLRFDQSFGLLAILFLFAVVWATDIGAYFAGRAFGGPKLAPRWSPNKTWSGAMGGLVAAAAATAVVASVAGLRGLPILIAVALALSVVSQAGDLFESAVKRRFGAKDSGRIIPGHGGVLDRLDGFVAAAVLACAIGIVHGGIEMPARGLLIW